MDFLFSFLVASAAVLSVLALLYLCRPSRPPITARHEPIVSTATGEVVGAEILYGHPPLPRTRRGWLTWHKHVPNLAVSRTRQLPGFVSLNVDVQQLLDPCLCASIDQILGAPTARRVRWVLEWTETAHGSLNTQLIARAAGVLLRLRKEYAAAIAIDDFGAGLDGPYRLALTRPEFVKLDGALLRLARESCEARLLARDLVQLAHNQGCAVVAEHVADKQYLDLARQIGADYAQGHHFPVYCSSELSCGRDFRLEHLSQ